MLVELSEKDKADYNHFVSQQPSGSFLQSWEWGQWQAALGRQVIRYKLLDANSAQIASLQLIKMPLWGKKYYWYAPYGPVVGRSDESEVGSRMVQTLKDKFSDAVFIRIEPKSQLLTTNYSLLTKSTNIQPGKTLLIDLSKSEEQLLLEMHHKTRYNIKLAQKHGVEVKTEFELNVGHGLFFEEALRLIQETSQRQKFATFPQSYYKRLADFFALGEQGVVSLRIYKAVFQNQLLAVAFMLDFGATRTFLFGGSSEFHKNVMAPYLLHWQAMLDAQSLGFKFYDFWGIETALGATPGFVRFKLGFGGEQEGYAGAYDIVGNKFLYQFYKLARAANKITRRR